MTATSETKVHTIRFAGSTLSVGEDGSLSFQPREGEGWSTPGPLFLLHYYDRQHPRVQAIMVPQHDAHAMGTPGTLSISGKSKIAISKESERHLRIDADFDITEIRIAFNLVVREDGNGFTVSIAEENVFENHSILYRILGVEILPNFGAAVTGEEGYLTLPNWFGCRTFFNKTYPREIWQTLYSSNDQWEHVCHMPVYGITRKQGTLCGLIAEGDYDAQLVHRVHYEAAHTNSTHPYLVYRWQQQDERITGPREVRYSFCTPDAECGEGYAFVGLELRNFLRKERSLPSWEDKKTLRPAALDYRDRFFLKIFMAYKDPQADGKGAYHPTCTFDEARQILQACKDRGMHKLCAILVGWGQDGHDGMPPTRFPVDERLGGEKAMKELIAWCKEQDIMLGVHDSYGGSYPCSPEHNIEDLLRHRSGEYWESVIWSGGQTHKICPKVWIDKYAKRDMPAVAKLGIHGHHHIDAVGPFMTCFSKEHPLSDRKEFVDHERQMFEIAVENIGSVSTELPFGPYFGVVDGYFHSYTRIYRWHRASLVGRYLYDETVPLLAIVVHDSLKCCESVNPSLEMIDWGLHPKYEVAMHPARPFGIPEYTRHLDTLAESYSVFYGPDSSLPRLAGLAINRHKELTTGVTESVYSDGTRVIVNKTDEPFENVEPQSAAIVSDSPPTPLLPLPKKA